MSMNFSLNSGFLNSDFLNLDRTLIQSVIKQKKGNPRGVRLLKLFQERANKQSALSRKAFDLREIVTIIKKDENQKKTCFSGSFPDYTKIIASAEFKDKIKKGASIYFGLGMYKNNPKFALDPVRQHINESEQCLAFLEPLCQELGIEVISGDDRMFLGEVQRLSSNKTEAMLFKAQMTNLDKTCKSLGINIIKPGARETLEASGLLGS